MEIMCPHCHKPFKGSEAIIRPRKEKYKWYEFSGSYSYCPNCSKRYQSDITAVGAVIFCVLIALAMFIGEYIGELYSLPVLIVVAISVLKFPEWFIKIEAK